MTLEEIIKQNEAKINKLPKPEKRRHLKLIKKLAKDLDKIGVLDKMDYIELPI